MAETIGSLIDKITIVELKLFHMHEQTTRPDVTETHRQTCQQKGEILSQQRNDLTAELNQLFQEVIAGTKTLNVYRQFKMYNDPIYRFSQTY